MYGHRVSGNIHTQVFDDFEKHINWKIDAAPHNSVETIVFVQLSVLVDKVYTRLNHKLGVR
jgi:hypothetical protein